MPAKRSFGRGLVDRIGVDDGSISHEGVNGKYERNEDIADHKRATALVIDALTDEHNGIIDSLDEIAGVGHRVVHGGEA